MKTDSERQEALLHARYGNQEKPASMLWNDQIEALLRHRSVRAFLPDALPEGAIETMVAAAQSASTSSNLHQWSVVAVTDPKLKSELRTLAAGETGTGNPYIEEAPALLLWVADMSRNNAITQEDGLEATVHGYVDALLMSSIDAALAAQNATIAAESLGLGVVYIGAMRNKSKEVAELINLPDFSFVVFGLVVGRPDPNRPSNIRPRPVQSVVLHHNGYDATQSLNGLDSYEPVFRTFREELGMKSKTWRQSVHDSNTIDYMDGRQNLRKTLGERGFKLL